MSPKETSWKVVVPLVGDALADDIGLAGVQVGLDFLRAQVAAGIVTRWKSPESSSDSVFSQKQ